jgi:hypothetical protein
MINRESPRGFPTRDWSSKSGATALAAEIAGYWAGRGRHVEVTVYEFAPKFYALRTNIVAGVPPRPKVVLQ